MFYWSCDGERSCGWKSCSSDIVWFEPIKGRRIPLEQHLLLLLTVCWNLSMCQKGGAACIRPQNDSQEVLDIHFWVITTLHLNRTQVPEVNTPPRSIEHPLYLHLLLSPGLKAWGWLQFPFCVNKCNLKTKSTSKLILGASKVCVVKVWSALCLRDSFLSCTGRHVSLSQWLWCHFSMHLVVIHHFSSKNGKYLSILGLKMWDNCRLSSSHLIG